MKYPAARYGEYRIDRMGYDVNGGPELRVQTTRIFDAVLSPEHVAACQELRAEWRLSGEQYAEMQLWYRDADNYVLHVEGISDETEAP